MKKRNVKVFFGFMVIVVFLSMPLLWATEVVEELENRLQQAASPSERLECLSGLVRICMQEVPLKAWKYGSQALQILQEFPDDRVKIRVLNGMCWACGVLGRYQEGLDMAREAKTLAGEINDKEGLAITFATITNIYLNLSDFDTALDYALKARAMNETVGNKRGIASALNSIARVHRHQKKYEEALTNYQEAMKITEELGNNENAAWILNNMGTVYWELKQYQTALELYARGLKIMKEVESKIGIAQIIYNIACVYSKTGKHTEALQYDMKALELFQELENKGQIAYTYGSIGRDYRNLKDYPKALDYLDKGLKMAIELGVKVAEEAIYEEYTQVYEAMGDYQNALLYHKRFKNISDDILNEDINERIAKKQVSYDLERTEKENQLLKKNNQIQKMELISLTMLSVLVLIIAIVTYNRYRTRKKAEQVLRVSEQKLKKMNAAKDKLFTIIAHDLGSPLNSLLLSAGHLENHFQSLGEEELEEFIHNIYKQTRDMSDLLENLLQWAMVQIGKIEQNPETVDFRLLTEETLEQIEYSAQKKKIHLASHIMENTFAWADKQMMKSVMRNLLANAVKYTHPGGEVKITSTDAGNRVEITVSDNGVGMDKEKAERLFMEEVHESTRGTASEKGTGLGLVLCKEFVEKNGGEIRVQSQPDQGSHFSFTLPKHH
ncbi:MAG: tetratricopeptide repeat protein [Candidatus Aminicenantes bacterium]|nr:tetratricopeptide repeat protein [Candidatus Aminicenantes bacterium]NIM80012.1 tetratricopeptide repeat protein [Candidatus Aminicenantes bacterium]NIN19366.1 tetratricopeptide repeat protein [Candidatus Aminicenantes bacterium]NIN43265.1 tetratricopeptide repeat protein [Candidatus Aminicenantes bacterium]NIN86007.1 tetratricopeptide repeat protein [Candidatus Aminicenantes bacterium]